MDVVGGHIQQDVHPGGQGLEQSLLFNAQNQLRRVLPGGEVWQLEVEVTLLGVGGLHGLNLFYFQLKVVYLLQAGGGGVYPQQGSQLVLRDVAAQRPARQQQAGQRILGYNGAAQLIVQLPGVVQGLFLADVHPGQRGIVDGAGARRVQCQLHRTGGVLAGQTAGGAAELIQQGVKGGGLGLGGGNGVVQRKAGTALECLDLAADEAVQHCRSHHAHQNQTQQNDQRRTQAGALFVGRCHGKTSPSGKTYLLQHNGTARKCQAPQTADKTKNLKHFCFRFLAERWGFEPQNAFDTLHDFQSCALDQLSHLSIFGSAFWAVALSAPL